MGRSSARAAAPDAAAGNGVSHEDAKVNKEFVDLSVTALPFLETHQLLRLLHVILLTLTSKRETSGSSESEATSVDDRLKEQLRALVPTVYNASVEKAPVVPWR